MSNLTKEGIAKLRSKYDIKEGVYLYGHVMHDWDDNCSCDNGYFDVIGGHSMACDCHSTHLELATSNLEFILDKDRGRIIIDYKYTKRN